jgi:uncharacterized membrane protein (DUF485 family)
MERLKKSLGVGFIFTFFVMCFYFGFSVLQAAFLGTDVVKAALDSVVVGFVLWGLFTYMLHSFYSWVDERNARDAAERQERESSAAKLEQHNPDDTDKK